MKRTITIHIFSTIFCIFLLFIPTAEAYTVYVLEHGTKYHLLTCRFLNNKNNYTAFSHKEAQRKGYTFCSYCKKQYNKQKQETKFIKYTAKVIDVNDGDTIKVKYKGKTQRIRFYGIDCPEKDQAFGAEAKIFIQNLLLNTEIQITVVDIDKYNRQVALLEKDNQIIQEILLNKGLAWYYPQYCKLPLCDDWKEYEKKAKQNSLGLWNNNPIPPWQWRKK